ncbi:MAG: hypothetical protein QOE33_2689 [Acidobacteriota bacterium]|nr:hypothetical protein [Acidobacteriota bacterium]
MNPKVFVSHASEDKERFVLGFATKLRAKGIDAWLDKWEILPGDSLIDKIFEEGIKDAQAVIVVLSKNSVDKPWVKEELNAAMVKKINGVSKLIPVVIDDCQVPEALQSTVWERVNDLNNYDTELERIVRAIYEHREKPPIGAPPAYAQTVIDTIPGLTKVDSLMFKLACETAIEDGHRYVINVEKVIEKAKNFDIPKDEAFESLTLLHERYYIEPHFVMGGEFTFYSFNINTSGFDEYARIYIDGYDNIFASVAFQLVNEDKDTNESIIEALKQPQMIVDHVLNVLKDRGLIKAEELNGGYIHIFEVSTELKRMLRNK